MTDKKEITVESFGKVKYLTLYTDEADGKEAVTSVRVNMGEPILEAKDVPVIAESSPVVAEAIQTILRREAYPHPYEALKALTRTNKHMDENTIHEFIQTLDVSDAVKAELMAITPGNYTGV